MFEFSIDATLTYLDDGCDTEGVEDQGRSQAEARADQACEALRSATLPAGVVLNTVDGAVVSETLQAGDKVAWLVELPVAVTVSVGGEDDIAEDLYGAADQAAHQALKQASENTAFAEGVPQLDDIALLG